MTDESDKEKKSSKSKKSRKSRNSVSIKSDKLLGLKSQKKRRTSVVSVNSFCTDEEESKSQGEDDKFVMHIIEDHMNRSIEEKNPASDKKSAKSKTSADEKTPIR